MRARLGDLRRLIREEREYVQALLELGGRPIQDFSTALDRIQNDLNGLIRQTEHAHELAPQGPAKAIVAGIHSDLFNQAAEIRKYVERLKTMAKASSGQPYR